MKIHFALLALSIGLLTPSIAQNNTKQILYLSGTDNTNTRTWDFFCSNGRNSGHWTKIQVPSCWQQQGFGNYEFGRSNFCYGKKYQYANEKGMYRYSFTVPSEWKGKCINIVFTGSMTDTEVKINGKAAGPIHQGAFYVFSYDISDKLMYGKSNLLEVTVSKLSADETVNEAEQHGDYWNFGGIFRPVYLEALPKEHIKRMAVIAKTDGSFAVDVYPAGLSGNRILTAEITDLTGKKIGTATGTASATDTLVTLRCNVANAKQWTAETPNLYRTTISLKKDKEVLYSASEKFGFRTIEIRHGDGIYLNGVKIKMKGINRHCFWPETGRTLNHDINLKDAQLIKEMNMNAVRCSHYPPDKDFLDICDSIGLYVIDELAGWQKAYGTAVGCKLVPEMVTYDVNHPSIIFWSNGNEGGSNPALDNLFSAYDPSKRTLIRAHYRPGHAINGIDCNHYEDFNSTSKILQDSLIFMPTEFLHCQDDGGGGAGLHDMWELMWASKRSGGGFLWALMDEGLVRTDQNGFIDTDGVNAPDGVMGPHREKEGSFFAIRQIFSPVYINLKELTEDFTGNVPVENRYHFTNLNQCTFSYKLVNFTQPFERQNGYIVASEEKISSLSVAPLEKGNLNLKLPKGWERNDAIVLTANDPYGNEIYSWTWKIKQTKDVISKFVTLKSDSTVTAIDTSIRLLTLKAGGISVSFDKTTGQLKSLANNDTEVKLPFINGPVLCSGTATMTEFKYFREADGYVVDVKYNVNLNSVRWKMFGNGWVSLDYQYTLNGKYPFAGISFDFPENSVTSARMLADGPYRVWKNRTYGVTYNVWDKIYNLSQTGYCPWYYPEFKGYYSNFTWMELSSALGKMLVATPDNHLYLRLFEFYGLYGSKNYPELPAGNISFLDGIPPVGTKMATGLTPNAARNGAEGAPNEMNGTYKHTLYFFFGIPESK
jgi:hypothetical protein